MSKVRFAWVRWMRSNGQGLTVEAHAIEASRPNLATLCHIDLPFPDSNRPLLSAQPTVAKCSQCKAAVFSELKKELSPV